jgi:hypothetical protein
LCVLVLLHGGVLAGLCRFLWLICLLSYKRVSFGRGFPPKSLLLVVIQAFVFWQRCSSVVLAACCHTSVCLLAEVFLLSPCLLVFTRVCLLFCFVGQGCYLLSPLLAYSSLIVLAEVVTS